MKCGIMRWLFGRSRLFDVRHRRNMKRADRILRLALKMMWESYDEMPPGPKKRQLWLELQLIELKRRKT